MAQVRDKDSLDVGRGSGEDLGLDEGSWALRVLDCFCRSGGTGGCKGWRVCPVGTAGAGGLQVGEESCWEKRRALGVGQGP